MAVCITNETMNELLAPIDGGVGTDLRSDISPASSYQVLRDARTLARNNERTALANGETSYFSLPDWKKILEIAPNVLATESKDVDVVAWYVEALTRCYGFDGIAAGFTLASQMIIQYGENLFPVPDEDGVSTQLASLIGLNGYGGEGALIAPIKSIPLTEGSIPGPLAAWQCEQVFDIERIGDLEKREARLKQGGVSRDQLNQIVAETTDAFIHKIQSDIEASITAFESFQAAVDNYCRDDPQPSAKILDSLKDCQQVLTYIAGDRLKREEVIMENEETENVNGNGKSHSNSGFTDALINDRQDALRLLRDIADFFRKTEPHSPISYSVEQIIRWSGMSLTDLIQELIPDESARKKYQNLSGISSNVKE
ncbi:MAG: type VI secretion system protein TssA [Cellvibrionaceae bacterium]